MGIDQSMKDFVMKMLNNSASGSYAYHNINHTFYVYEKVIEIAIQEHCSDADIRLLKAAALWHDAGYIHIYDGHEEESCILAQQQLPAFGFLENEILMICKMIMATKMPQSPATLVEEIIADADLEYLGTEEALTKANQLFAELKTRNTFFTQREWNETQISFLKTHHYFTNYCKQIKEPVKQKYLNSLLRGNS
jgi:uncharacterized protein